MERAMELEKEKENEKQGGEAGTAEDDNGSRDRMTSGKVPEE